MLNANWTLVVTAAASGGALSPLELLPAEKGKKASFLRNLPSESKKCPGLKTCGVSHSFLSKSTDERMVVMGVPWKKRFKTVPIPVKFFFSTSEMNLTTWELFPYLWNKVSSQCCVFTGHFGESKWNNISHPLDFMDDCVSIG